MSSFGNSGVIVIIFVNHQTVQTSLSRKNTAPEMGTVYGRDKNRIFTVLNFS